MATTTTVPLLGPNVADISTGAYLIQTAYQAGLNTLPLRAIVQNLLNQYVAQQTATPTT